MIDRIITRAMAVGAVIAAGSATSAQDADIGKEIYMDRCSVCHGEMGEGDGLVAELFDRKPKNLKLLAKEMNGSFPFSEVYQSIDGRREITGHGYSRMPIWGDYFIEDAIADRSINPKDARIVTQGRILAVVYYLQSIQAP